MNELIAKLEAAPCGNSDMDAGIASYIGLRHRTRRDGYGRSKGREWFADSIGGVEEWSRQPPAYTTSLDAAMALVPQGWMIDQMGEWDAVPLRAMGPWFAIVRPRGPITGCIHTRADHHPTAPLALCIAALKAQKEKP